MEFSIQQLFENFGELKWYTLTIVAALALLGALGASSRRKWSARMIAFASLSLAASFLLSLIVLFRLPQGGSVTPASYLPVMFFAYVFGPSYGLLAGTAYGLLQLLQGFYAMHPISLLLDYILAFASLGLTGFFKKNIYIGMIVSAIAMATFSTISGVVFYASYAPEGMNPLVYSIVYNFSFVLVNTAICILIAAIPPVGNMMNHLRDRLAPRK